MFYLNNAFLPFVLRVLVSVGVSAALLAVLIRFTLSSTESALWSQLVNILANFSWEFLLFYVVVSMLRIFLRALRYRLLLKTSETDVPGLYDVLLVTLSRNMFVDMFPARLGELSYIVMLNRGYRVSGQSCVSSLAISFVFDLIALAVLIMLLVAGQLFAGDAQGWMFWVLTMLVACIFALFLMLYPVLNLVNRIAGQWIWMQRGMLAKVSTLLVKVEQSLRDTRKAQVTKRILVLSLGIRMAKYLGLYSLFVGVVITQFPDITTRLASVVPVLISAEAGASLPVPAFMGFGTYEAGGALALIVLGASKATSLVVMLAIHVLSQIIDYCLGAIGVILFILRTTRLQTITYRVAQTPWRILLPLGFIIAVAGLFLTYEIRAVKKRGAFMPPDRGEAVLPTAAIVNTYQQRFDGFIIWSSNRSGNHDIYLKRLPDGAVQQLTNHPHTEYYPRISPNGKQIVFARSHQPWVSQRNIYPWDVYLLDLKSGKEQLLAKNGNLPTWSIDGKRVFFQRHGNTVVELNLRNNRERILYQSGQNIKVPPKTALETPSISAKGDRLAVTFRNTMRATGVVGPHGEVRKTGNGCQLNWGPGDRYLYKIDHGGKMKNALYKIDAKTLATTKWFDAPGDYSHEYFPRLSNTADVLVYGASSGGHEHDTADYEIFLWVVGEPANQAKRITFHTGNDCWPDVYLNKPVG